VPNLTMKFTPQMQLQQTSLEKRSYCTTAMCANFPTLGLVGLSGLLSLGCEMAVANETCFDL
jgi:hypothetical protein